MSKKRFSDVVENILREAGWFPGRTMGNTLLQSNRDLERANGFELFPAAEAAISEFGGLVVDQEGPGTVYAREPFHIDPTLAIYEGELFAECSEKLKTKLYPLGEAATGNYFLAIGEDGRVFLIMEDILSVGENIDQALENLILGNEHQYL